MMTSEEPDIDHIVASERFRLSTFDCVPKYPQITREQLALAGFILRNNECFCCQCGIHLDLLEIKDNIEYPSNYFRKMHRMKNSQLGKRCGFLICEVGTNIDNLRDQSSEQDKRWPDAEEPDFSDDEKRLASLQSWSPNSMPSNLPQQTFIHSSSEEYRKSSIRRLGPNDGVTCFYCGNTLVNWAAAYCSTNSRIVELEHARFFPCRFLTCMVGGKFVTNAGYLQPVSPKERHERNPMSYQVKENETNDEEKKPRTIEECLLTYEDWPQSAPISAQVLANAGFYYLGTEFDVKCFVCNLKVSDWRYSMTALGTHRKRSGNCPLVLAIEATVSGDFQAVNEKWRLKTLKDLSFSGTKSQDVANDEKDVRLARELAACGFYRLKNQSIISCAFCGVKISPKSNQTIMAQHRFLSKQLLEKRPIPRKRDKKTIAVDCPLVRANCPSNVVILQREPFPEYPMYQSLFDRLKSFENHKKRPRKLSDEKIKDMAEAGFFLDEHRRLRCFQCGNSLPLKDTVREKLPADYNMAKIHAHYHPTCEWVREVLGVKYIAQVLHDRYSSETVAEREMSTNTTDLLATPASTTSTLDQRTNTPTVTNVTTWRESEQEKDPYLSADSYCSSSDDDFQTIAQPSTAFVAQVSHAVSNSCESTLNIWNTLQKAQTCTDKISVNNSNTSTSHRGETRTNPFKELLLQAQQIQADGINNEFVDPRSPEMSPLIDGSFASPSPVNIQAQFAYEANRLETFKKNHLNTFADVDVAQLAYVGFYYSSEGKEIRCNWCEVKLTEDEFKKIMNDRPSVPRSALYDEPWTPMRVHRHANGLMIDEKHTWCVWVRRQAIVLYPNVALGTSQLKYPEYPSFATLETRTRSFTGDWIFPSGSRLSNQQMAHAGFFHMGGDNVCCFYCGNKLQKFERRDCPFEEHATFYPMCDYIQNLRGLDYINRIILECGNIPRGRLRYEMDGQQQIKRIVFVPSAHSERKRTRPPVQRVISHSASSTSMSSNSNCKSLTNDRTDSIEENCLVCSEKLAIYEYDVCRHCLICGECYAKLPSNYHERCMVCMRSGKFRLRVPTTPLLQ